MTSEGKRANCTPCLASILLQRPVDVTQPGRAREHMGIAELTPEHLSNPWAKRVLFVASLLALVSGEGEGADLPIPEDYVTGMSDAENNRS